MLTTSTGVAAATMRTLGSHRLPSLATRVATAADGSRVAWDRVIVWSPGAQRQLRDGFDPVASSYPGTGRVVQGGLNRQSRTFQVSGAPSEGGSTPARARGATST